MNNDFKKASYFLTIILFLLGITALVGVSAAKYFQFDETVVTVSQITALLSFFLIFLNCIVAKSKYNNACMRFADYILTNRRKEEERKSSDAQRMREMQNIRAAAEHDREKAVEAARQQGRNEGAQLMGGMSPVRPQMPSQQPVPMAQPVMMPQGSAMPPQRMPMQAPVQQVPFQQPMQQRVPVQQPVQQPVQVQQALPEQQRNFPAQRRQVEQPNEEVLYNEYGEPVMMRRRVRKTSSSPDGEMLYDSSGNPVIRRNQGLWEPLEQRHEIVVKFETSPGLTVSSGEKNASRENNPQQSKGEENL